MLDWHKSSALSAVFHGELYALNSHRFGYKIASYRGSDHNTSLDADMLGEHFPQFPRFVDLLFQNLAQDLNLEHLTQMSQGYDELPELSHKESWGPLFNCISSQAFPICSLVTNHKTKVSWQLEFLLNIITEIVKLWFLSMRPDLDGSFRFSCPSCPCPGLPSKFTKLILAYTFKLLISVN